MDNVVKLLVEIPAQDYEKLKWTTLGGSAVEYQAILRNYILNGKPYEEKPEGMWIEQGGYDGDSYFECSICGEPWELFAGEPKDNNMNYCPKCGSRMSGTKLIEKDGE